MPILINNKTLKSYYSKIDPILRNDRNLAYFMLILSLFSLSFFGVFALKPTIETIVHLQKEIVDSKDVYQKLQTKSKNLLILQGKYQELEKDLPLVFTALPEAVNAPTFLLKVRTLATLNNIKITNLQIAKSPLSQTEVNRKPVASVFVLTATGSYKDINDFLVNLSTLDRVVTFSNIGITPGTLEGGTNALILKFTGKIYTLFN